MTEHVRQREPWWVVGLGQGRAHPSRTTSGKQGVLLCLHFASLPDERPPAGALLDVMMSATLVRGSSFLPSCCTFYVQRHSALPLSLCYAARTYRRGHLCPGCYREVTGRKSTVETEGDPCEYLSYFIQEEFALVNCRCRGVLSSMVLRGCVPLRPLWLTHTMPRPDLFV